MRTLICGSIAYDTIMVFKGHFGEHILPEQVHILNVAFLVPEMRREFGGCAGNIAYNLHLLGGQPTIMATVGSDAGPYLERLARLGLAADHVRTVAASYTAQAFITTDIDDNQITAFHPGAMSYSHQNHVADARDITLGIVSPDGRDGMLQHGREFAAAGVPFIFDPGQGLPMFDGPELLEQIALASYVTVNDYEAKLLCDRTGKSLEAIAALGKTLIVTLGAKGSQIYHAGKVIEIGPVKPARLADPTGCGDAYRAGLLYGIAQAFDWETTGRLASTMGSLKIAAQGPQNHTPSRDEIALHFQSGYGYRPW
jgi:adenosine kinase